MEVPGALRTVLEMTEVPTVPIELARVVGIRVVEADWLPAEGTGVTAGVALGLEVD